jgi:4-alpha-glucanotransferase
LRGRLRRARDAHEVMKSARIAGVTLPLFAIRTVRDWGMGQITDLPVCAEWLRRSGHRLLQLLPAHELSDGETSPYGALTAFGLDPVYAGIEAIEDLDRESLQEALGPDGRRELERVRLLPRVDYSAVRALKMRAWRAGFRAFLSREWEPNTTRARQLRAFIDRERGWLDDLALYTALRESHDGYGWETWPEEERERLPRALEEARSRLGPRILEVGYQQWTLVGQWERARAELRGLGVELMGDLPFAVGGDSVDVWARASQFQRHMSLGAPPDAFSPDGQDWGLPPYNWLTMEADDLAWVRARAKHAARLYDRFRLDHVVGYFRQWVRRKMGDDRGRFDPDGTDAQCARGRRALGAILREAEGAQVVGEDLGVIPPFVRAILDELKMPGYRVLPWEKVEGKGFRSPSEFPPASVASWSTHDTPPVTAWWDDFTDREREELSVSHAESEDARSLALLSRLYGAGSDLALVLVQELLGQRERINTPGTVTDANWTYRLPQPLEELGKDPRLVARANALRGIIESTGRGHPPRRNAKDAERRLAVL